MCAVVSTDEGVYLALDGMAKEVLEAYSIIWPMAYAFELYPWVTQVAHNHHTLWKNVNTAVGHVGEGDTIPRDGVVITQALLTGHVLAVCRANRRSDSPSLVDCRGFAGISTPSSSTAWYASGRPRSFTVPRPK